MNYNLALQILREDGEGSPDAHSCLQVISRVISWEHIFKIFQNNSRRQIIQALQLKDWWRDFWVRVYQMITIDQDNWVSEFNILLYQWKGTYKKGHIFQQALIFNTPIRKRLLNCDHFSVIFACISLILSGTRYSLFMIVIIISMVISWIPGQQISRRQIVYNLYSELQLKICGELSGSPFVDRFQSMKIWWQSKSKWCKSIG